MFKLQFCSLFVAHFSDTCALLNYQRIENVYSGVRAGIGLNDVVQLDIYDDNLGEMRLCGK